MKLSQKLHVTIEDISYTTTYADLDDKLKPLAARLDGAEMPSFGVRDVHTTSGDASLYVGIRYAGKIPKQVKKVTLFGQDQDEFMAKQYK